MLQNVPWNAIYWNVITSVKCVHFLVLFIHLQNDFRPVPSLWASPSDTCSHCGTDYQRRSGHICGAVAVVYRPHFMLGAYQFCAWASILGNLQFLNHTLMSEFETNWPYKNDLPVSGFSATVFIVIAVRSYALWIFSAHSCSMIPFNDTIMVYFPRLSPECVGGRADWDCQLAALFW